MARRPQPTRRDGDPPLTEYTVHIPVPDAALASVLQYELLDEEVVTCVTVRSGNGTWISFGVAAGSDDDVVMAVAALRYSISRRTELVVALPEGYDSLEQFEHSPIIITHGRTVAYSEGIMV